MTTGRLPEGEGGAPPARLPAPPWARYIPGGGPGRDTRSSGQPSTGGAWQWQQELYTHILDLKVCTNGILESRCHTFLIG